MIGDVELRPAGAKGLGVFACRHFAKGEFIFRRRQGAPFPNARIAQLSEDDQRHLCEIDFERSAVLYPPGCYLNHSCEPNAMRSGVKVFAWRPIARGDEITIDYRLNAFGDDASECLCGAESCPGRVTWSFFALDAATQQAYLPYAPPFIQREMRKR